MSPQHQLIVLHKRPGWNRHAYVCGKGRHTGHMASFICGEAHGTGAVGICDSSGHRKNYRKLSARLHG
jgi:hypothetical protein